MTGTQHSSTAPASEPAVYRTDLPLPGRRSGKVRDIYELPADRDDGEHTPRLLIVATDRISAFDVVMPTPIPGKGRLLTAIAVKWFEYLRPKNLVADHLLSTAAADVPGLNDRQRAMLDGRVMICRAAKTIPVECVVRGYLAGSGWLEYQETGKVCGVDLPRGLTQSARLPEPIFTPATKAEAGHDMNIDFDAACEIAGRPIMERLRDLSIAIYTQAARHAEARGLILADTKFEFGYALNGDGRPTDEIILIDEILTPDSSRYWPADQYEPGRDQHSFDKQYVRNDLLGLVDAGQWDKTPPGPELPEQVVRNTAARYREALARLFPDGGASG